MNRLDDTETIKNAFEISGHLIERIVAVCQGPNEANKWVELLSPEPIVSLKPKISDSIKSMSNSIVMPSPTTSHVSIFISTKPLRIHGDNFSFLILLFRTFAQINTKQIQIM